MKLRTVQQYKTFTCDNLNQLTETVSQFLRYTGVSEMDTDFKVLIFKEGEVSGILKYFDQVDSCGDLRREDD